MDKTRAMLPTPDISHLTARDYETVYEPAEDSFLFLDALEAEQRFITQIRPLVCLEVGSGSGVVAAFLAKMLGDQAVYFTTDLNVRASEVTQLTGRQNGVLVNPVTTDLVSGLLPRLRHSVDVLLFNPPYVVTPSEEVYHTNNKRTNPADYRPSPPRVGSHGIEASWAGGVKGREVIDRFLPLVGELLSERGALYLMIIQENDKDDIATILGAQGLMVTTVMERRSGPEKLAVLKFTRYSPGAQGGRT